MIHKQGVERKYISILLALLLLPCVQALCASELEQAADSFVQENVVFSEANVRVFRKVESFDAGGVTYLYKAESEGKKAQFLVLVNYNAEVVGFELLRERAGRMAF